MTNYSIKTPWISVEGVDGAGKSSHIESIKKLVSDNGFKVLSTREPGGTQLGERLRDEILNTPMELSSEIFLVFASRSEHLSKTIIPALKNNLAVICDRFTDSTYAYQGFGEGYPIKNIAELENIMNGVVKSKHSKLSNLKLKPDLTLVFDLPIEIASQRLDLTGKTPDKFESQSKSYFERVRNGYARLSKNEPHRVKLIDSSPDWKTVNKNALSEVQEFLNEFKLKLNRNKNKNRKISF